MGEHDVQATSDEASARAQQHALLEDISALGHLLAKNFLETGVRKIGAEQEIFLIDKDGRPAPVALEVLAKANDPRLTTEIALFNLEANLTPLPFTGDCLRRLQSELEELMALVREAAAGYGATPVLCGILPTLLESDLAPQYMTPNPRYHALSSQMSDLRTEPFHIALEGQDRVEFEHQGILSEGCNTSFQLHYQVDPERFAHSYNLAQLLTGPVLAACVNSPLLFGQRLWSETRIGLFQQSVDARSSAQRRRASPTRVSFGERWVDRSVLELFREDIERHRVVLSPPEAREPSMDLIEQGRVPTLAALRLHNGTVYRWNRPCLGLVGEQMHLRIEARAFPAGPSIVDEIANAALFLGALHGGINELADPSNIDFARVRESFFAAAREGLEAKLVWVDGKRYHAKDLLLRKILPMAYRGLHSAGLDFRDSEYYLGIIAERLHSNTTGASWMLSTWGSLSSGGPAEKARELVLSMREQQARNRPVHTWPSAPYESQGALPSERVDEEVPPKRRTIIREIMSKDLFTAMATDTIEIALAVMRWQNIRHLPIEDEAGRLVGMLTEGTLLRAVAQRIALTEPISMIMEPIKATLSEDDTLRTAMRTAKELRLSALPVVSGGYLVGLITEYDLVRVADRLLFP